MLSHLRTTLRTHNFKYSTANFFSFKHGTRNFSDIIRCTIFRRTNVTFSFKKFCLSVFLNKIRDIMGENKLLMTFYVIGGKRSPKGNASVKDRDGKYAFGCSLSIIFQTAQKAYY